MHHKWQSYDVWFLTGTHQTIFCYFGLCFALLPAPPMDPGNQNFEKKWKKHLEIFIILKMCTINDNHMMHGSQDIEHDRQNFLSLWTIFCPLTLKQPKKYYQKWQSCDVWFLRYGAWWAEPFVILDHFLTFYPANNLKNQNFEKMKKMPGVLSFYTSVP